MSQEGRGTKAGGGRPDIAEAGKGLGGVADDRLGAHNFHRLQDRDAGHERGGSREEEPAALL